MTTEITEYFTSARAGTRNQGLLWPSHFSQKMKISTRNTSALKISHGFDVYENKESRNREKNYLDFAIILPF